MDPSAAPPAKPHRPSRSKTKKKSKTNSSGKQAVAKPGAFARRIRLSADRAEKRAHNPSLPIDRTGGDAAPRIVAVVGPSGVGKSTIIRNLIKHYAKRNIPTISGPITVVTGRRKRITFIEVGPDLSSMIDAAKVADLVLLVIDASFGFEMETFEFLNIAAAHGMPKIMAVLTHLDKMRDGKQVRRTKKSLKDRIWAELYDGAKVFYLSGLTTTGDYLSREVLNLARFISVIKYANIKWRADHAYILADRVEDISPTSLPSDANRSIAAYGYIRGTPLRTTAGEWRVHLAGVGDLIAKNIEHLPDPCPAPELQNLDEHESAAKSLEQPKRKRKVSERDRIIYAPMAPEVDGISYDRDAVYINLVSENIRFSDRRALVTDRNGQGSENEYFDSEGSSDGEGEKMVKDLQKTDSSPVDESLKHSTIQLVSGGKRLVSEHFSNGRRRRRVDFLVDKEYPDKGDASSGEQIDAETEDETENDQSDEMPDGERGKQNEAGVRQELMSHNPSAPTEEESTASNHSAPRNDRGDNGVSSHDHGGNEDRAAQKWKNQMLDNARERLRRSTSPSKSLSKYVYTEIVNRTSVGAKEDLSLQHSEVSVPSNEDGDDDHFFTLKRKQSSDGDFGSGTFSSAILDDFTRLMPEASKDWISDQAMCANLRKRRFGTGQSGTNNKSSKTENISEDGKSVNGDFEDLETGEVHRTILMVDESKHSNSDRTSQSSESDMEEIRERKIMQKRDFDSEWDQRDDITSTKGKEDDLAQSRLHQRIDVSSRKAQKDTAEHIQDPRVVERDRLERAKRTAFEGLHEEEKHILEGILPGQYIRLELQDVPIEFVRFFNPHFPIILGGLKPCDDDGNMFLRARVRRHRFKRGVLKSHDPVIFSIGWRRFQSMPVYDIEDQGGRRRFLKYTPEYLHCNSTFWGPSVAPGAGVIMCQSLARDRIGFRIAGSGHVTEVDTSINIAKKLKLIGEPFKVYKNTAFIKGMFNSELEVSKYIGAGIRTVSGIRGTIKKAITEAAQRGAQDREIARSPAGSFRGGFEDKVLLSDIVFLRAWVPVELSKFCSIATTLLDKERAGKGAWRMRTIREIREDRQLPIPHKKDSIYGPIQRVAPQFTPLKISRKLESSLPYASKPKTFSSKKSNKKQPERKGTVIAERAVVLDKKERNEQRLLQAVYTIRNERSKRRKEANTRRLERRKREWEHEEEKRVKRSSERRKRKFALEGAREVRVAKRNRTDANVGEN